MSHHDVHGADSIIMLLAVCALWLLKQLDIAVTSVLKELWVKGIIKSWNCSVT